MPFQLKKGAKESKQTYQIFLYMHKLMINTHTLSVWYTRLVYNKHINCLSKTKKKLKEKTKSDKKKL